MKKKIVVKVFYGKKRLVDCMKDVLQAAYDSKKYKSRAKEEL